MHSDRRALRLQVVGGLGSRLRVAVGGLAYCMATGRRLIVHWPYVEKSETAGVFDCRMSDLYTGPFGEAGWDEGHWSGCKDDELLNGIEAAVIRYRTDNIEALSKWFGPHDYRAAFDTLRPTGPLMEEVSQLDEWTSQRPVVGVHVRRAMASPKCVGPEWHIERLRSITKRYGDAWNIFLMCDDRSVEDLFAEAFPGRVRSLEKTYLYDRLGILRQCADTEIMHTYCQWVIGSNHSSLSHHIALARGARYVHDSTKPNHVVGGDYEDAWCAGDEAALKKALQVT